MQPKFFNVKYCINFVVKGVQKLYILVFTLHDFIKNGNELFVIVLLNV